MIGGKNPLSREPVSKAEHHRKLWKIAEEQKCPAFKKSFGTEVQDDHLALNRVGIPAVDIIDFTYRHWHRLSDVPENCTADG